MSEKETFLRTSLLHSQVKNQVFLNYKINYKYNFSHYPFYSVHTQIKKNHEHLENFATTHEVKQHFLKILIQ